MQNQDFDLRIFSDLLNTEETLGQKVRPLRSFEPGLPLPLAQLCMEYEYLVKAKFWGKYLLKSRWLFVHAIMMADCPTTGGYPKIGTVASADLPLLVQCVPNKSKIRFRETTVAKVQKKYRVLMSGLDKIVEEE